jgi:hypothetical protein
LTNEEFVNVASTNDVQPSQMKANVDGKYYAIIFESASGRMASVSQMLLKQGYRKTIIVSPLLTVFSIFFRKSLCGTGIFLWFPVK